MLSKLLRLISNSGSFWRFPRFQVDPSEVAFGIFFDCKANDLMANRNFDFFLWTWWWKEFRVDIHCWWNCLTSWIYPAFSFFAILAEESNLSVFIFTLRKFFWTFDGWNLFRTFKHSYIINCSIKLSISDWVCFPMKEELDACSVAFSIYFINFQINLFQVECFEWK